MLIDTQPASTLDNLARLATKPGVQSTLILSKADGSIIRSSGLLAASSSSVPGTGTTEADVRKSTEPSNGDNEYVGIANGNKKVKSVEEVARMVFSFVSAARDFADGMDDGDEVKLLRLRSRKNEIVVVPGQSLLNHECRIWGKYKH